MKHVQVSGFPKGMQTAVRRELDHFLDKISYIGNVSLHAHNKVVASAQIPVARVSLQLQMPHGRFHAAEEEHGSIQALHKALLALRYQVEKEHDIHVSQTQATA